ncbi:hypothetical protein M0R04_07630 [Candidatus Dojkabacteria bacterium]|jgi:hypothetical protein|nr:hypothetical protein [Candidatus Dojkabacteria bacterium]
MKPLFIKKHEYKSYQPINIKKTEDHYGSKFIGDFCIRSLQSWTETPAAVFYQPNPNLELGHTHYFGLFVADSRKVIIVNAESAFVDPIIGVVADDGEIIFSRYRHDFVWSGDRSVYIDGGRDYVKTNVLDDAKIVKLIINEDHLDIKTN